MIDIEKEIMKGNREKYTKFIYSILRKDGTLNPVKFNKDVKNNNEIAVNINNILKEYGFSLRVFRHFIDHPELKEFNIHCPICGNKINLNFEFREVCSRECVNKNPKTKEKRRETFIEKFGVDNPQKSEIIKDKTKKTNLRKYGNSCSLLSEQAKKKARETNLRKYGTENSLSSKIIQEKVKKTLIKNLGVDHPSKSKTVREKFRNTMIEKHGVDHPSKSKKLLDKARKTKLTNYRTKHYGDFLKMLELSRVELLTSYEEHLISTTLKYKCKDCGLEFEGPYKSDYITTHNKIYCPSCVNLTISAEEKLLSDFVASLVGLDNIIKNSYSILDSRKQLDVYIPNNKLAIEFNGIFWHSIERKTKNYHIEKTLECKEKGIRLIHVFENDWRNKKEIVKSIISSALGIYKEKIYARKCIIKELSENEYKDFLNSNHIQGYCRAKIKLGLFYNNELVSCIGISRLRYSKNEEEMEVIRFCNKINTKVIGSLSKLLKHSNIKNLISYVDLNYFDGSGYEKCGFKLLSRTDPDYFYVKNNLFETLSREKCQKKKLQKLLGDKFDPNLTETENMLNNGYLKIYGCGNLKYKLEIQ